MMKVQNDFYELKSFRMTVNRKDVFNFILSIVGLIIANVELIEFTKQLGAVSYKLILYDIIICLAIIGINIYGIINKREAVINKIDVKRLEEKNKNLLEVNDSMRCFKHDFNNIMQAIDGYIFLDDMSSLQVYFKSLLDDCNYVNSLDRLNCKALDNPAIYGVLLNKYKIAKENNVQMNVDILVSLNKLSDKTYIVSRMLGILLDNAIEATNGCEEKIVNVQFIKEESRKREIIIIENTYIDNDIDTNRIFDKNYTTKKGKGNSGLGLWKIKNILSKDSSLELFTTKDGTMFKQQLEIYGH